MTSITGGAIDLTSASGTISVNNSGTLSAAENRMSLSSTTGSILVTGTGAINAVTDSALTGTGIQAKVSNSAAGGNTGSVIINYAGNITSGAGGAGLARRASTRKRSKAVLPAPQRRATCS